MKEQIGSDLRVLVHSGEITPDTLLKISRIVEGRVEEWRSGIIEQLRQMIIEWETTMGDEDKSFYTLGIRRAVDLLNGRPAFSELPILEKPDTPDEFPERV